ncbi:unnamed protein product [Arctogadus glacialis]
MMIKILKVTLKRSFDIDDEDDTPSAPPMPPPSSSRTQEGRGAMQPPASTGLGPHSPFLSPRGGLKSRSVSSSLSFSHGNKPAFRKNGGGGVARAASFQNRFHPNGYYSSLSGPGSDNDSLHSSSSSLEGPPASAAKYGGGEYQHLMVQGGAPGADGHQKTSSHGGVFLSEDALRGGAPELGGGADGQREGVPLGFGFANNNAGWGGRPLYGGGAEILSGSAPQSRRLQQHGGPQGPQPPRAREPPRLNKFPLDLENLTMNTSPKPPPRGAASPPQPSPSPPQPSPLSGVERTPSPPGLPHLPPSSPRGSLPVPGASRSPPPPAQTPLLPGPQAVQGGGPGAARRLGEEPQGRAPNSVGSVLRRIASFSHGPPPDGSGGPAGGSPKPRRAPGGTRDGAPGGTRDGAPGGTRDGAPGGTRDGAPGGTRDGAAGGTRDGALSPAPLRREKDLEGKHNTTPSLNSTAEPRPSSGTEDEH